MDKKSQLEAFLKNKIELKNQSQLKYNQIFKNIQNKSIQINQNIEPQKQNFVRFVCLSDTHCLDDCFINVPDGDVLIHAGDFTKSGSLNDIKKFSEQLKSLNHPIKIVIAGNHDISFDLEKWKNESKDLLNRFPSLKSIDDPLVAKQLVIDNCTHYLEDQQVDVLGYKIYGSPWTPTYYNWGFNLDRGNPIKQKWDLIPQNTDILITHGPPFGYGDLCQNGIRAGCQDLLDAVLKIKPQYHIYGHIHEDYGIKTNADTLFVNACSVDLRYQATKHQIPIVFDLPKKNL